MGQAGLSLEKGCVFSRSDSWFSGHEVCSGG